MFVFSSPFSLSPAIQTAVNLIQNGKGTTFSDSFSGSSSSFVLSADRASVTLASNISIQQSTLDEKEGIITNS
jgi:hypothetical protein